MQSQVCVCLGVVSSGVGRGGLTGLEPPPFELHHLHCIVTIE